LLYIIKVSFAKQQIKIRLIKYEVLTNAEYFLKLCEELDLKSFLNCLNPLDDFKFSETSQSSFSASFLLNLKIPINIHINSQNSVYIFLTN